MGVPHLVVKLYSGRSEQQKALLADELSQAVMRTLGSREETISIAIEDVEPERWTERVYEPEIAPNLARLYKKPGTQD